MTDDLPATTDETMTDERTDDDGGLDELFDEPTTDDSEHTYDEPEPEPEPEPRGLTGPQDEAFDPLELYDLNRHRVNGDETAVILSSFGRGYQAVAVDVDKSGEVLDTEVIGDTADREAAESMCDYWIRQHPKGILGGDMSDDGDSGGEGIVDQLAGMFGGEKA